MYDMMRCGFLSGSITLFASVPSSFEMPLEKIGFGALLFFIIWTYMRQILPKVQEEMQKLREENRKLLDEISRLNKLREQDQKLLTHYMRDAKSNAEEAMLKSGILEERSSSKIDNQTEKE
jgi:hypothetical protein